jgi:galactokinase
VVQVLARDDPAIRSLRDVRPEHLRAARDRLDPVSRRRAEHVVSENERVLECVAALEADDRATIGSLFAASHASLRDRYQVSSPELDAMVEIARSVPGVVAARMTGAGFGGCTVNLLETGAAMALRRAVEAEYAARTGLEPMVLPVSATAGAGRLV